MTATQTRPRPQRRRRKRSPRWLTPTLALLTVAFGVLAIGGTPFAVFPCILCLIAVTFAAAYR
jgi:hypothetical protein